MEKIKDKAKDFFGYIIIAFTCALYVLASVFVINPTGKTIGQIIGEGILSFFIGIAINRTFTMQGLYNGKNTNEMKNTMSLYANLVDRISKNINKLENWCNDKNSRTYKRERTKILARAGMKYDDYFLEDGTTRPFVSDYEKKSIVKDKKLLKDKKERVSELIRIKTLKKENSDGKKADRFKRKSYWIAVKLKLTELHASDLTSEGGKRNDPNYLGQTIKGYLTESSIETVTLKIFLSILFGIYGLSMVESFSWINLVWAGFQIFLFLFFGYNALRKSYMFITNEYRGRIIKKIDNLEEFNADISAQKSQENIE